MKEMCLGSDIMDTEKSLDANVIKQKYSFVIKLSGENEVPIDLLCTTLNEFNNLTSYAKKNDCIYNYNVVATNQGSFEVAMAGFATVAVTMFTTENINYIKSSLSLIKEWFDLKKHLDGNKPKSVTRSDEGVRIENTKGDVIMTSNEGARYLENAKIDNSIVNIVNGVYNDNRQFITILGEKREQILNVEHDDYENLSRPISITPECELYINHIDTNLLVNKATLNGDAMWDFYFNKNIHAKIEDENWLIDFKLYKYSITSGVQFKVTMRTETQRDKDGTPLESTTKYYIEKVHRIIFPFDMEKNQIRLES